MIAMTRDLWKKHGYRATPLSADAHAQLAEGRRRHEALVDRYRNAMLTTFDVHGDDMDESDITAVRALVERCGGLSADDLSASRGLTDRVVRDALARAADRLTWDHSDEEDDRYERAIDR